MKPHTVYLSRRNLETLLAKLDHKKAGEDTACTLIKQDNRHPRYAQTMSQLKVVAVENEEYYTHREPGPVADLKARQFSFDGLD